jgi:chromatin segregation and condensation protein Rec8/ScpA/Scc1 (kleisin family)
MLCGGAAVLASTLLAGLELARDGAVSLEQERAFEVIRVSPDVALGAAEAEDAAA